MKMEMPVWWMRQVSLALFLLGLWVLYFSLIIHAEWTKLGIIIGVIVMLEATITALYTKKKKEAKT